MREQAPSTPAPLHVEDGVRYLARFVSSGTSARFVCGNERLENLPFVIAEVGRGFGWAWHSNSFTIWEPHVAASSPFSDTLSEPRPRDRRGRARWRAAGKPPFSPVTARSIAKPRASTGVIDRTPWKIVVRKLTHKEGRSPNSEREGSHSLDKGSPAAPYGPASSSRASSGAPSS